MSLNSTIEKHLEELSVLRMEHERIKNQVHLLNVLSLVEILNGINYLV